MMGAVRAARLLLLAGILTVAAGCGQKGPLYRPEPASPERAPQPEAGATGSSSGGKAPAPPEAPN